LWRGCVSLLAMASSAQVCPGSPSAPVRAKCYMAVRFDQPCVRVRAEAEARIAAGPAFNPHNGGLYSLLTSSSPASLAGQRTTGSGSAPTHYTDRFTLTFNASSLAGGDGGEGCLVSACSESQGLSYLDFSTNYCNLRILYCGDADGCPSLGEPNLGYEESFVDCGHGATHSSADCLPHSSAHGLPPSPAPLSAPLSPPWDLSPMSCRNSCDFSYDGGEASTGDKCGFGTDCADCGPRVTSLPSPQPGAQPGSNQPSQPGAQPGSNQQPPQPGMQPGPHLSQPGTQRVFNQHPPLPYQPDAHPRSNATLRHSHSLLLFRNSTRVTRASRRTADAVTRQLP